MASRVYNTQNKATVDYREYPTTARDTLRHHRQLWSLPYTAEEAFPVGGGHTCIPGCAPFDDGLFMIGPLHDGDVLCPVQGTRIPSKRVTNGQYQSSYIIQDHRSGDIIDAAEFRFGYHRLANDILEPKMYNARLRTDTSPVWTLVVIGDWEPPHEWAYEVLWFYGKDYKWHQPHLQSFQEAIQVLPDSPYAFVSGNSLTQHVNNTFDITAMLPIHYQTQIRFC
jgi:hypothetical protein